MLCYFNFRLLKKVWSDLFLWKRDGIIQVLKSNERLNSKVFQNIYNLFCYIFTKLKWEIWFDIWSAVRILVFPLKSLPKMKGCKSILSCELAILMNQWWNIRVIKLLPGDLFCELFLRKRNWKRRFSDHRYPRIAFPMCSCKAFASLILLNHKSLRLVSMQNRNLC